mmetsp:Transcript_14987/g.26961  ORF Transcript_14987/g.26961 Transcript_14987/m.26961 type:complete len:432 (+) Transcript_14987:140-1435(+)|eukprot:CAMPEP_0197526348 /NCGR_PEP_ID=MMETSP1318-20131121/17467_1 /TAXON_ID=552666 /ORGANISM="Partenskyella glossopodia, Strain RCC365" /LENGTH=431 /DNA_ID=CAMNT_0043080477 /DNA_START=84 /DNA_END=1379 /DNA_ORIENTATION=-
MYGGDEVGALVIDTGTTYTKAGYAGEDLPKVVIPTAVGNVLTGEGDAPGAMEVESKATSTAAPGKKSYLIGGTALKFRRDHCEISRPLQNGIVKDWDAVEGLWDYAFAKHLRVDLKEFPVLVAEPTFNPPENRKKVMELLFEKHDSPATFLVKDAVLASFAVGKHVALVVDVGGGVTSTVPVHDGYVLNKGVRKTRMAGEMVDVALDQLLFKKKDNPRELVPQYLLKKRFDKGIWRTSRCDFPNTTASFHRYMCMQVVRDIKESICRVADSKFDPKDFENIPRVPYELPDGKLLELGSERYEASEVLFNPVDFNITQDIGNYTFKGIPKMVIESINTCEPDIRRDLYSSIVLTGGTSNLPGLTERMNRDLDNSIPSAFKVKTVPTSTKTEKSYGVWIGGSILASLGTFHQMWLSKAEYEEHGVNLLRRKCP